MSEFAAHQAEPLGRLPFFSALDGPALGALAAELEWLSLPGGRTLFREGEAGDALYFITAGCLRVTVRGENGKETMVTYLRTGEMVGEMAIVSGEPRSATVTATRDSELFRLSKPAFDQLVDRYPKAMLSLISLLVRRLRSTTYRKEPARVPRTIALVPTGVDVPCAEFAHGLAEALATTGRRVELLDATAMPLAHTTERFSAVEAESDLILYQVDLDDAIWSQLCLRQADRVVLVASAKALRPPPVWLIHHARDWRQPIDLIALHDGSGSSPASTIGYWRDRLTIELSCNIRHGNRNDLARLARLLMGEAVGLVLGGGGARGFAHIGVIRALREAQIPIDLIGGCSMGAIVGAAVALEWDDAEIEERMRRAFVDSNPLSDYTLPLVALVKGKKLTRLLNEHFGETCFEDVWRPYFCVSTNLTAGALAVHREGALWQALQASVAIPGLLPPIMRDGEVYVDGGVMNHLPVDVMSAMRRGPVIGVDVATDPALTSLAHGVGEVSLWQLLRRGRKIPPIVDILARAGTVSSDSQTKKSHSQATLMFAPTMGSIDLLDWRAYDRAISAGYRHAIAKLECLDNSVLQGLRAPVRLSGNDLPYQLRHYEQRSTGATVA